MTTKEEVSAALAWADNNDQAYECCVHGKVLAAALRSTEAERDGWMADAKLCAINTDYWQTRAEQAEAELKRLVERCDGPEGIMMDGSNIQTIAAHACLEGRSIVVDYKRLWDDAVVLNDSLRTELAAAKAEIVDADASKDRNWAFAVTLTKERDEARAEAVSAWDGMRQAKNTRDSALRLLGEARSAIERVEVILNAEFHLGTGMEVDMFARTVQRALSRQPEVGK